jgi:phage terminase large subunit
MDATSFTQIAQFQPKQLQAWYTLFQKDCKYLLYGGAASGGKSYFLRWAAVGLGIYYAAKYHIRGIPIGLFSEDYPTLKDRQISRIKREFPAYLGELKDTRDEGYVYQIAERYGGAKILLRNLDDPSKYASTEFAAELVEELTKNSLQTFEDLRFRLRYPGIADPRFVAASNPGSIGHEWVKRYFIDQNVGTQEQEQALFHYVKATVYDNQYVDQTYIQQLQSLPEQKRKAYLEGSWDVFAGQFFSEFRMDQHVIHSFIPDTHHIIVAGMDWGRAAPFAFHLAEVSVLENEGVKYFRSKVFCEVYGTQKTPHEWADDIKAKLKRYALRVSDISWMRADPAVFTKQQDMSISIADQFKNEGLYFVPASNDRIGGWENLHNWLRVAPDGKPYLQITEDCPNLIRTLPNLVHDENKVEDVDTDGEDHAPDALRYLHKHLKWIDAKAGGVKENRNAHPKIQFFKPRYDGGQMIAINTDRFVR